MPQDPARAALSKLKARIKRTRGRNSFLSADFYDAYTHVLSMIDEEIEGLKKKAAQEPPSS